MFLKPIINYSQMTKTLQKRQKIKGEINIIKTIKSYSIKTERHTYMMKKIMESTKAGRDS